MDMIDENKGKNLIDITKEVWRFLTPEEYIQIICIYSSALNRKRGILLN